MNTSFKIQAEKCATLPFPAWKGRVDFGVYNVWNRQYRTVFAQQAAVSNANPLLAIPAEGRTYGLSYTFNY